MAFVFGSIARGEDRAASDLDLMVIGRVSFAEVVEALRVAESETGREINATVYPPDEFQRKLGAGQHFLTSVVGGEKLSIVGGEGELRNLLGERMNPST